MVSRIKDENYYQITGWMLNRLKLKGTQLNVYAIIYGFSQDGENAYTGSLQYLCDFIGASKPTAIKALKELVDKNYILKEETYINNVQFNKYKVNLQVVNNLKQGSKETLQVCSKETLQPSKETLTDGSKETLHNNKDLNNKINNKDLNNKGYIDTPPEKKKFKLGTYENVLISNEEITKLSSEFGEEDTKQSIEYLSEEIEFKGYKAKSHYLAIRRWVIDAIREKRIKQQELAQREQRAKDIETKQKENENKYMFHGKRISDLSQAEYEEYLKDKKEFNATMPMYNWLEPHKNKQEYLKSGYNKEELNSLIDDQSEVKF